MKYIVILLLIANYSFGQELSKERIEEMQYKSEMRNAGILLAYSGVFIELGFQALDQNRIEAHLTSAAFSVVGIGIAVFNLEFKKKKSWQ